MAYPNFTSAAVMDRAAALNDDPNRTVYTYNRQLPFLNSALQEMQEYYELNNVPVTDTFSTEITVPANVDHVGFEPDAPVPNTPYLPEDLIEPKLLWVRQYNNNPYIPMQRVDSLPHWQQGTELNYWTCYVWQTNQIKFMPANQINQIRMDYTRNLFSQVTDEEFEIPILNGQTFLEFRTAALVAQYLAQNPTRATTLNGDATIALDRALGITTKGRQAIQTRRRPFRMAYKRRFYS